ncbi:MAG: NAD(P)H-hydrate dehydratase [Lachnospiraceae bacterium]|nr:NAD(P)H-hydrate dehydratase [Lachnospiraceae bacterium]
MKKIRIATGAEAKAIDQVAIEKIGIPSLVLMENAASALTWTIRKSCDEFTKVLVVCGSGNNGADGVACARNLWEKGIQAKILIIGEKEKFTSEMEIQCRIAKNSDIPIVEEKDVDLFQYDIIVDCIFGVGLSREITGKYKTWIAEINASGAKVVSADIPSGINATTGEVMGIAVRADITVTFGLLKCGLVLYPGTEYAGKVEAIDIGFPKKAVNMVAPMAYTYAKDQIKDMLPKRSGRTHKGTFGKTVVIGGSRTMCGACYFAAEGAYRVGSGLVHIITAAVNRTALSGKLPEALITTYEEDSLSENKIEEIKGILNTATSVVIGPGLSLDNTANQLLDLVLQWHKTKEYVPVIIDADGLNLLSKKEEYFEINGEGDRKLQLSENIILTPHLAEMSRLCGAEVEWISSHMQEAALNFSKGNVLVLKDARTLVSDQDDLYINMTGNSALSTGGSGDVLSGIIAGLAAQGLEPMDAACVGVCLHGMAADRYVEEKSAHAMLASDILTQLQYIL